MLSVCLQNYHHLFERQGGAVTKLIRNCVKVEVDDLGSLSLTVLNIVSVDVKQHWTELSSCVKVEVDVLGSPSLIVFTVHVDVKQHWTELRSCVKVEMAVLGYLSLIVLGRKATFS